MVVDLNNSSISSRENVATEITSAWKYANFVDGIKRGCSGTRSTKMRSGRDTALQIATRSNRTGDDEAHQQACAEADTVIVMENRECLTRRWKPSRDTLSCEQGCARLILFGLTRLWLIWQFRWLDSDSTQIPNLLTWPNSDSTPNPNLLTWLNSDSSHLSQS